MSTPASTTAASAPSAGWQRQLPRYRATRDLWPPSKAHFRRLPPTPPLSEADDIWQYCGRKPISAGTVINSESWPHKSFEPINESARRVLEFFNARRNSWLPLRPFEGGRVVLNDGLTSSMQPKISIVVSGDAA